MKAHKITTKQFEQIKKEIGAKDNKIMFSKDIASIFQEASDKIKKDKIKWIK